MEEEKYLFLFFDVIQGKCSKYWLDFYFKPGKHREYSCKYGTEE